MVLFPTQSVLNEVFSSRNSYRQPSSDPSLHKQPRPRFSIWSVTEDAKNKAGILSQEAAAEISKASAVAQAKTGKIELYSAKFYAVGTFGGLMACVGIKALSY